jgi:hypothetical protein
MRFIFGVIIGALITIGAAYIHDSMTSETGADATDQKMVNWSNVHRNLNDLGANINATWKRLSDQLREKV